MNQFWTPLSKVFGLSERENKVVVASPTIDSNWPTLFELFQKLAINQWVSAWQRHREVSPEDVMSIRGLTIQAGNSDIQNQLDSWRNEGSSLQLIEWLVNGPWNTPEIRQCVHFGQLTDLTFLPLAPEPIRSSQSAYEETQAMSAASKQLKLILNTDHVWMPPPAPQPTPTPEPNKNDAWFVKEDIQG
jgi:hypothetical protein